MKATILKVNFLLALTISSLLSLTAAAAPPPTTNYCGPVYPPPLGVTFSSSGSGSGYSGGITWDFNNTLLANSTTVFWGARTNDGGLGGVKLSFTNYNLSYSGAEVMTYSSSMTSAAGGLNNGYVVWSGSTHFPYSGTFAYTRCTMHVTLFGGGNVALMAATSLGLPVDMGGLVPVTSSSMHWQANILFEVSVDGSNYYPALDFYNNNPSYRNYNAGGTTGLSFGAGFNYVNVPPTITSIANVSTNTGSVVGPLSFTVGDLLTAASSLTVTAVSSNQSVVTNTAITLGGSGAARTISLATTNVTGNTTVTVTVNDGNCAYFTNFTSFVVTTTAADIGVQQPVGTALTDGVSSISFGNQLVSTTSTATTLTITNLGSATLILTNIAKDGANAGDFTVSALGSTSVAVGGSTTFTVTFTPSASGSRSAALHITNNVAGAKNPFDITLTGTGTLPGASLDFDGADDYVDIDSARSSVSGASALTIEMWVNPGTISGQPVLWSGSGANYIQTDASRNLYLEFGGTGNVIWSKVGFFTIGAWQHVAMVFDGSQPDASRWKVYKDGSLVTPDSAGGMSASIPSLGGRMLLGAYSGSGFNYHGSMDEVRIWNRALSACEIQAHKDCELSGTESGLVAYYKFNQGMAGVNNLGVTTLTDSGPNGFNGTLNNFGLTSATSNWQTPGGVTTGNSCSLYTAPKIDVRGGSPLVSIGAGDVTPTIAKGTEFGTNLISSSVVKTFTITNSGTAALNVSSLTKSGANAADFTLGTLTPASPIATNGSATFTVTFTPSATGLRTATITITNDDCDEGSYAIAVQGKGNIRPSLTFPASPVIAEATSVSGAVVTYTVTAIDVEDGTLTPTVTPASGSTFAFGDTTVNVSATDSGGLTTNTSFTVTVRDTTAPVIAAHGNVTAQTTSPAGTVVTYTNVVATDAVGVTSLTYSQNSGTTFPLGTTIVTNTAADAAGNVSTSTFTVTVNQIDYTITTGAGVITVTNTSGTTNTLDVSEPSVGTIQFAASGRTFSVNSAPLTTDNSGPISISGITNIVINGVHDSVNVGTFTETLPSFDNNCASYTVGNLTLVPESTLTINVTDASTISGGITGTNASLVKTGAGKLTLTGTNTYSGTTVISNGTLIVHGILAAGGSNVLVASSGILGGTGTVDRVIFVATGGTVSPGASPGILTVTNITFTNGAILSMEITGTNVGTQYDQLNVTGTVALNNATLALSGAYVPGDADVFVIINNDSNDAITGTFNGLPEGSTVTINGVDKVITYVGGDGNDVALVNPADIAVQQPAGTDLADGSASVGFGFVSVATTSTAKTFTITNAGRADLTGLTIGKDGANASEFTVSAVGSTPVAAGGSTTFTVTFTPTASGARSAAIHITNNVSGAKNPFDITLTGTGNFPPTLSLPVSPVVAEATSASGAAVTFTVTASDFEDGALTPTVTPTSGSTFAIGDTTVNVSATDTAGATTNASFVVRVHDTTAPVVVAHADVTVVATTHDGAVVTYAAGSATDAVGVTSLTYSQNSGTLFPLGLTTVTITAKDAATNTATGTFTVRVIDFSGDLASFQPCWRGLPNSTFQQWAFSAADDATNIPAELVTNVFGNPQASVIAGDFSSGYFDTDPFIGSVQGIWDLGRYGTMTLNVSNNPALTAGAYTYVQVQVAQFQDGFIYSSNAAVSLAGGTLLSEQQQLLVTNSFGGQWIVQKTLWRLPAPTPSAVAVVLTGGYYGSLIDQVVVETLSLDFPTPSDITANANSGLCAKTNVTWIMPTIDGCVVTNVVSVPVSGSTFSVGMSPVTYVVADGFGATKTFHFNVNIIDDQAPLVLTTNITVALDALGHATITSADIDRGSTDNCDIASRVVTPDSFTCDNKGSNTVSLIITDIHGNSATNTATVLVIDATAPTVLADAIAPYYATTNAAQAAALSATTISDNCDANPLVTVNTVGTCSAVVTVMVTDVSGNTNSVSYHTRIDALPPVIGAVTATNNLRNVRNGAAITLQGAVNFTVAASDNCSLANHPDLTLTNGAATAAATFVNESPAGTFNYVWNVTASTANGTWNATVTASDSIYTTTNLFTLVVNKNQIVGQVELDGFIGTGTVPAFTREVTFVVSTNWVVGLITNTLPLLTNTVALTFVGDTAAFTLTSLPGQANGLSAKANWNLRRKLPLSWDGNTQGTINFTGSHFLLGGDLDGDNQVAFGDYTILGGDFYTFESAADINGDGQVDYYDYFNLYYDWFTAGDPQ